MRTSPESLEPVRSTDADLLTAVAAGNLGALGTLYDRHARAVWRVLHRVTNDANDVEDLVHATFLKLPEIAAAFDGRSSCRNWVCGIAVRLALTRGRSLRRIARTLGRFGDTLRDLATTDPETQASRNEEIAKFERALHALSPKKRAAFVLVELQGMRHEEVAEALEIPVATVRTRLFHAKRALRDALSEENP